MELWALSGEVNGKGEVETLTSLLLMVKLFCEVWFNFIGFECDGVMERIWFSSFLWLTWWESGKFGHAEADLQILLLTFNDLSGSHLQTSTKLCRPSTPFSCFVAYIFGFGLGIWILEFCLWGGGFVGCLRAWFQVGLNKFNWCMVVTTS